MAGASSGLEAALAAEERAPGYRERLEYSATLTAFEVSIRHLWHGCDKKPLYDQNC